MQALHAAVHDLVHCVAPTGGAQAVPALAAISDMEPKALVSSWPGSSKIIFRKAIREVTF